MPRFLMSVRHALAQFASVKEKQVCSGANHVGDFLAYITSVK